MKLVVYETRDENRQNLISIAEQERIGVEIISSKLLILKRLESAESEWIISHPNLSKFQGICQTLRGEAQKESLGELVIDQNRRKVMLHGQELMLTITEYKILTLLVENPGRVINRNALANAVLRSANESSRSLDVHVFSLRKKLLNYGNKLKTIRGVGYSLDII